MFDSLLIRTLQLLNQEEVEILHLFVATPLFNEVRPRETRELFEYLKNYYPDFDDPNLAREKTAALFFPNHRNPDAELQRTMAQLLNIIRQFVAFRYFTNNKTKKHNRQNGAASTALMNQSRQQLALLRFYSERLYQNKSLNEEPQKVAESNRRVRKSENLFQNLYKELKKSLYDTSDYSDFDEYAFSDLFYFRFLLEQERALYESLNDIRINDINILQTIEELDQFYLITKLDLMCKLIHYQRMLNFYQADSNDFNRMMTNREISRQLVGSLKEKNYLQSAHTMLYSNMLELLLEEDPAEAETKYENFILLLKKNEKSLTTSRLSDISVMLRSFWPSVYRETKDRRFLERLQQMQIENLNNLPEEKGIPNTHFTNIIFTAIKLNNASWADDFYTNNHNRVIGQQNDWFKQVCQSSILLAQNKAEKAAQTLGHYFNYGDMEDIYLYCIASTLDVRIRYTLDDLDSDESERLIKTSTMRIRRDSLLPEHRKKERLRFFTLVKSLYRIKVRRDLDKRADLSKDLAAWKNKLDESPVVDWEWLEEKYSELLP